MLHRFRHVSIHACPRNVHGPDADCPVDLDVTLVVLLARDPFEALSIELEGREVVFAFNGHDVDAL